jgi:lipoprotein
MRAKKWIIALLAAVLCLSLSACVSAENPFSPENMEGKVRITLNANGGKIGNYEVRDFIFPEGSYMIEPGKLYGSDKEPKVANPVLKGYEIDGWYRGNMGADGKVELTTEFDFNERVYEDAVLYANWKEVITYNYKVVWGENWSESRSYEVNPGDPFTKPTKTTELPKWTGHTLLAYYWDEACTQEVVFNDENQTEFTHPGDINNRDVLIYTKWLEGDYVIAYEGSDLLQINRNNVNRGIYLMNDVDMTGIETDLPLNYRGTIEGNGYKISNWKVDRPQSATGSNTVFGLFNQLTGAKIQNVTFENCSVSAYVGLNNITYYVGFLAGRVDSTTEIKNVKLINCSAEFYLIKEEYRGLIDDGNGIIGNMPEGFQLGCDPQNMDVTIAPMPESQNLA